MCTMTMDILTCVSACRGQKWTLEPMEVGGRGSCKPPNMGDELWSFGRAANVLNHCPEAIATVTFLTI